MTARTLARSALLVASLLASCLSALRLEAVLVVFDDGRHIHAEAFDLENERVTLHLAGGGLIALPLERIERILDDEVIPEPEPPSPAPRSEEPMDISVRRQSIPARSMSVPYFAFIREASERYRIDVALIAAVIRAESGFQPSALSPKGARGLMQLMPATARRLGVMRPYDPRQNLHGGVSYLSELAERFGEFDVDRILAAYNAGEGAVEEYGGIPPYRETRNYVRKVKGLWKEYSGEKTVPVEPSGSVSAGRLSR